MVNLRSGLSVSLRIKQNLFSGFIARLKDWRSGFFKVEQSRDNGTACGREKGLYMGLQVLDSFMTDDQTVTPIIIKKLVNLLWLLGNKRCCNREH